MKALRRSIILFSAMMLIGAVLSVTGSDISPFPGKVDSAIAVVSHGLHIDASPNTITIAPGETAQYDIAVYFEGYTGEVKL